MYCGYRFKMATPDKDHVTVFTFCPNDWGMNEVVMTNSQFCEYERAVENPRKARKIQDIFPDFTPEQREFLMTGYCHECQERIFGKPMEGDEE